MDNRYVWNPWHGCKKVSEGCRNCYVMYWDNQRQVYVDGKITKSKTLFDLPVRKDREGNYKIPSGSVIMTNMASDFFVLEADQWRDLAWRIIDERLDLVFQILTKRLNRALECLPDDWGESGYDNVLMEVSVENQEMADLRIPELLEFPAQHRGLMLAPLLESIDIRKYLETGLIESITVAGENYENCRACNYDWVHNLYNQAKECNVHFEFYQTGERFIKNGKIYTIKSHDKQRQQAYQSGLYVEGKEIEYHLKSIGMDQLHL